MAKNITIINADRKGFRLLIDGKEYPELTGSVAAGSINIAPAGGHALVHLALVCEHVSIEHDGNARIAA